MNKIKKVLSELRGALGGYGFLQPPQQVETDTSLQDTADFHREMKDYLVDRYKRLVSADELDDDAEIAIYWFANDHHSGQSDPLYAVLSQSVYTPGQSTNSVEDEDGLASDLYQALVDKFGRKKSGKKKAQEATMSSGRYIGQVLGNVIGDIEKGRVDAAINLLKRLKADLEKAGSEVVEQAEKGQLSEEAVDSEWLLTHLMDGLASDGGDTYDDAMINAATPLFGFTPSGMMHDPESAAKVRAKLEKRRDDSGRYQVKVIDKMLSMLPEAEA